MTTRPTTSTTLSAGLLTGVASALLLGGGDAVYALSRATDLSAGLGDEVVAAYFSAGLYAPLTLLLGLLIGLVLGEATVDVGPIGVLRAARHLLAVRGREAGRLAGAIWASLFGLVVTYFTLFRVNRMFMVTFKNQTLSSLLLAFVTLLFVAAMVAITTWGARRTSQVLDKAAEATRLGLLRSPAIPVGLVLAAGLGGLLTIPHRFEETWDALDLRLPVMLLLLVTFGWLGTGLLARLGPLARSLKARLAGAALALVVGVLGLFVPTLEAFGTSSSHAPLGFALGEKSALTRYIIKGAHHASDDDGDGYAAILAGGDCDDTNPAISPAAEDVPDNGIDEDCDGADFHLPPLPSPTAGGGEPTSQDGAGTPGTPAGDPVADKRKPYNIVWVMVDTLRWDRTGFAGYDRSTTPNTDPVAERGTVFEDAYSVSAKTPTAIAPIMASRYPSEMPRSFHHFIKYDPDNVLIAEILQQNGYLTAASSAHWYFLRKYGMAQGFYRWRTYEVDSDEMEKIPTSAQVTDQALMMLEHLTRGELPPKGSDDEDQPDAPLAWTPAEGQTTRPWFLYVHYLDPHKQYIDHKDFEPFGKKGSDRYDGEIRFVDHHLGRLWAALEKVDPGLANTIVIFTSDHGEAFGEHDMHFHGWDLLEHQIHASFFMRFPGGPAQRVKSRSTLMDLAPTLLDAVGLPPAPKMRGTSMLQTIALGSPLGEREIFTEMPPGPYNVHFRSLTIGDLKLIHRLNGNVYRLFDLAKDPGELNNVIDSREADAKRMKEAYQIFKARNIEQVEAHK